MFFQIILAKLVPLSGPPLPITFDEQMPGGLQISLLGRFTNGRFIIGILGPLQELFLVSFQGLLHNVSCLTSLIMEASLVPRRRVISILSREAGVGPACPIDTARKKLAFGGFNDPIHIGQLKGAFRQL